MAVARQRGWHGGNELDKVEGLVLSPLPVLRLLDVLGLLNVLGALGVVGVVDVLDVLGLLNGPEFGVNEPRARIGPLRLFGRFSPLILPRPD